MTAKIITIGLLIAICTGTLGADFFETPRRSDLILFAENERYGFLDIRTGSWAIPSQFDHAQEFSEGLAAVELKGKWGYIDETGKWQVKPQYVAAFPFNDGMAGVVISTGTVSYVTKTGDCVVTGDWHKWFSTYAPPSFAEGLGIYSADSRLGYVDREGKTVIAPRYEQAEPFSGGIAHVMLGGKWMWIDKTGQRRGDVTIDGQLRFAEGLASASLPVDASTHANVGHLYGYIGVNGQTMIEPRFISADGFSDGLAAVRGYEMTDGGMKASPIGYIDQTGHYVIEPRFNLGGRFSDGMAAVNVDGQWGYIDKTGAYIVRPQFKAAAPFVRGFAIVSTEKGIACIDTKGTIVWGPRSPQISTQRREAIRN